ncbi:DNA-binding transcriptional LysR family regulator [Amycolatopsis bartoniae]|uniref:LysR family transcriptional regulator n=2 Tax=Amycolatopsis bartoniae TaxID=941986 RepID=A0A8H9MAK8_9PSEU|nr:LysR family transcriptional regulator [Amycolatopsis bartoniae]MBB2936733.1 DNA-binding transcriptional LysR family regulator [Amycolatopsis bartoniae]TVT09237.1 LysR family transcriptional regulator [Amycolatopsis bartoniae]GHF49771.1 LysR family transcriptional regulator [Amycolatopsis bartoniae]
MRDFDLNLVRTFVLLYETRSVTATAESLHVTQPTVSYGLQKLRRRFSDELFRRSGNGLVPTTTAKALYPPLHGALAEIEAAVSGARSFDPASARTTFTLCLSDLGEVCLLPRLMATLPSRAPGVTLTVRPLDVVNAVDQLGRGEIDAFIASPLLSSQRVARVPLFTEGYVGMVAANHPRLRGKEADLRALAAERHIAVFGPAGHDGPRRALEAQGLLDRVVLEMTRFATLLYLVQDSELVAIVPRLVGEVFGAQHRVRLLELPMPVEPAQVSVYARHRHARTPAQQWLVDFMHEVLAEPRG